MAQLKHSQVNVSILDDDVIAMLVEGHKPIPIPANIAPQMRHNVMQKIKQAPKPKKTGLFTLRANEGEWIEAMPGAKFKVLHDGGNGLAGLMSYFIKLEPGFTMQGHDHFFDEQSLLLEGDLSLGDLTLSKGDFHYATAGAKHGSISTKNGCIAFIYGGFPV